MIPVVLPGLPAPDGNVDSRVLLGDLDLSAPLVTPYGQVFFTGRRLTGWSGGAGSTSSGRQRAFRPGAVPARYPRPTPKTLNLQLTLQAESPAAMREAWDVLNATVTLTDFTLTRDEWGLRRSMTVRRDGPIGDGLFPAAVIKTWSAQLYAADPRKYGEATSGTTGLPSTTGGLLAPFAAPLRSDALTVTGVVALRNSGLVESPVRLRIDGPVPAPQVLHRGSGLQLVFGSSYRLPAGNWLDVDPDNHVVLENGQVDRSMFVTRRGWFTAAPGDNEFVFSADAYEPAARLTAWTAPAWE